MAKNTPATTTDEPGELTLEQRVARLEKAAMLHGWDLDGGSDTEPQDPPV